MNYMDPKCHIICIGNEIMLGHIANTNAQYISKKLSSIGIKSQKHISIPDQPEIIINSIKESLSSSNIVIITGGLGPTVDDLTLECISKALNKKLVFQAKIANHIRQNFKNRKLKMPKNNLRQALIPEGAIPILNEIGTAPGLIIPIRDKALIALPGVPFEMYSMLDDTIVPYIKKEFLPDKIIKSRVIRITGLPESRVNEKIEDILRLSGNVEMGIYPHPEEITVKITAAEKNEKRANSKIKAIEKKIESRLGNYIFGYNEEVLEEIVARLLLERKKTLAIAESCTGGLLGNRITNVPGSSRYFKLGLILYSNESKNKMLGIPLATIRKHGAVSKKVTSLMAKNVRLLADSDIGVGISGIAGPGGATKNKPVGLVYIALSTNKKTICKEYRFLGQREAIKQKATQAALNLTRLSLH